jgi:Spy/CpxP family protein refolding chaperone
MKTILIAAALLVSTISFAQSNKEDVDFIQAMYGKEKKDVVAGFIKLEGAQKDAFWKLYDEYETQRKELGKKRVSLLEKYVGNYGTMDDATTDALMKEMTALGVKTDKLIETYYGKMKKSAGVKAAAQFVQLEVYLLSVVRATILENIPFIGELD